MNTRTPLPEKELDSFETALLHQLREVVAERPAPVAAPAVRPQRRWGRRLAAAAAAAALAGGGYLASPLGTSPAFAVTTAANGDVTVTVNRLEGADALEKALADKGIRADVTFPARGTQCRDGRYASAAPPAGEDRMVMSASVDSSAGQTISVPKSLLKEGETLVIESMWPAEGSWAMRVAVAAGAVSTCEPEPFDATGLPNLGEPPSGVTPPQPGQGAGGKTARPADPRRGLDRPDAGD